jgi:hypothetical protein
MNNLKKRVLKICLCAILAITSTVATPKKAEAGVIIGVAGSTVTVIPVALAAAATIAGMGAVITSVYWAIDNRDKAWWAWGLFMLDNEIANNETSQIISQRYPELDSYLVSELALLIEEKAKDLSFKNNSYSEIVFNSQEIESILQVLNETNPELAKVLAKDLTTTSLK